MGYLTLTKFREYIFNFTKSQASYFESIEEIEIGAGKYIAHRRVIRPRVLESVTEYIILSNFSEMFIFFYYCLLQPPIDKFG